MTSTKLKTQQVSDQVQQLLLGITKQGKEKEKKILEKYEGKPRNPSNLELKLELGALLLRRMRLKEGCDI